MCICVVCVQNWFVDYFLTQIILKGNDDYDSGVKFIQQKYEAVFSGSLLYCYVTCAIDKNNIERVFQSVKNSILIRSLESTGFDT
jgi:hypothetical protein